MTEPETRYHIRTDGLRLAYRLRPGRGPAIVFLPGYMSDMAGGKATALDAWAEASGRAMLRLDYSGCGSSDGDFEDGTIDLWRDDVLALVDALTAGPLLLVGSSMGGWLMLLVALARRDRIAGLVGVAAAPDFTEWGYSAEKRRILAAEGRFVQRSAYGGEQITTAAFWRSGTANCVLGAPIPLACPVRLLHGQADADVPFGISLRLAEALGSGDVQTLLVKDGDHRLSRPCDIATLIGLVGGLLELS